MSPCGALSPYDLAGIKPEESMDRIYTESILKGIELENEFRID